MGNGDANQASMEMMMVSVLFSFIAVGNCAAIQQQETKVEM